MRSINVNKNKKAQVWVETVVYTLIGLSVIAVLLAVAKPKIDSMKDKLVIEQTISSMNSIDSKITSVKAGAEGNRRLVQELKISKGKLIIDASSDEINWIINSKYEYSEAGTPAAVGNLNILTQGTGPWDVNLNYSYTGLMDITYNGKNEVREINSAPTPYTLCVENMGAKGGTKIIVDIKEC